MGKINLENVLYHIIPAGIVFLIYSLTSLIVKDLSVLVICALLLLQIGIMQFIMNANTMAKRPYMTLSNITGYVKPKRFTSVAFDVILTAGIIVLLYIFVHNQFGNYLMTGVLSKFPKLFIYTSPIHTGILGNYIVPIVTATVMGVVFPLFEGIYFRGFLLYEIRKMKWVGVGLSAFLFALTHMMTVQYVVYYLVLGVVLSSITFMTKNLYIGIFAQWLAYGVIGVMILFKVAI